MFGHDCSILHCFFSIAEIEGDKQMPLKCCIKQSSVPTQSLKQRYLSSGVIQSEHG